MDTDNAGTSSQLLIALVVLVGQSKSVNKAHANNAHVIKAHGPRWTEPPCGAAATRGGGAGTVGVLALLGAIRSRIRTAADVCARC